jgi:hypothetical protein
MLTRRTFQIVPFWLGAKVFSGTAIAQQGDTVGAARLLA